MRNVFLKERTAKDIDVIVAKILRDLGSPEPPLKIEEALELLRLDRGYYSSSDQGILSEVVHRMKMGGKQVLKRPMLLFEAIKKLELKAFICLTPNAY